jgi:hypothetical protein
MAKAVVLLDETLDISERYRVEIRAYEIEPNKKHPEGVKVSFTLIDVINKVPRLLIDNHAPFGFHVHEELPENKESRRILKTVNYLEALDEFWKLVKDIINDENQTPKSHV